MFGETKKVFHFSHPYFRSEIDFKNHQMAMSQTPGTLEWLINGRVYPGMPNLG
jgi:hypothetical protein